MVSKDREEQNIYLVGMMGVGKSTIGKILAKEMQRQFIDTDHLIEERCGVPIPVIFEHEGEAGFRKRESEILEEISSLHGYVVATGGGIITIEKNRALLSRESWVIYLKAQVDDIYQRTRYDKNRPLLQTENPLERIATLLQQRDPWYSEVASQVVQTEKQSAPRVIAQILQIFNHQPKEGFL